MARPSVTIQEVSVPGAVAAPISTGRLAYVVAAEKGIPFQFLFVTNEKQLEDTLGAPTTDTVVDFELCRQFLQYANDLVVIRAVDEETAKYSRIGITDFSPLTTNNLSDTGETGQWYFRDYKEHTMRSGSLLEFYAKTPSVDGDDIMISISRPTNGQAWVNNTDPITTYATGETPTYFNKRFEFGPDYANEEIAIIVWYKGEIVEEYVVSLKSNGVNLQNENIFIEDYLAANSDYIYAFKDDGLAYTDVFSFVDLALQDGNKGLTPTADDFLVAYDMFKNKNEITFDYIIDGSHTELRSDIMAIPDYRKDCVGFVGTPASVIFSASTASSVTNRTPKTDWQDITDDTITDAQSMAATSWNCYYSNWKQIYSKYVAKNIWIPITADVAGNKVFLNGNNYIWTPPAGALNGRLRNVIKLAFNPTFEQQDDLYMNRVNCVINKKGKGPIIDGQKTLLDLAVGVARLNIRDLFRYLEINIGDIAEDYLHEFNDEVTRNRFTNACDSILRQVQINGGIVRYQIVCDETNNTPAVINAYGFRADIKVEGKRPIENIVLKFFDVPAGVAFEEVV